MPTLSQIVVYPVKSLDGASLAASPLLPTGALQFDRQFALFDDAGKVVNGKRTAQIQRLRATFTFEDPANPRISLRRPSDGEVAEFGLASDHSSLETWLGQFFGFPVHFRENADHGFPDDLDSPGPTVISQATLETVASWFPGLDAQEVLRRMRANLVVDDTEAFWEDRLYAEAGVGVPFTFQPKVQRTLPPTAEEGANGATTLLGTNPCQRCVVPTRSSWEGTVTPQFTKKFTEQRAATLPEWATASRFNHFYRLAVNTRPPADFAGGWVRVGDAITLA